MLEGGLVGRETTTLKMHQKVSVKMGKSYDLPTLAMLWVYLDNEGN